MAAIILIILTVGLTATFTRASGRFNLPLSWILSPSGVSVDLDNNGIVDNVDSVPSGLIAMFDTNCPSGWTRLTALDGKFLTGGASYNAVAGGSDSITLTTSNLPAHTHGAGTLAADEAGAHTHQYLDKYCTNVHHYSGTADYACDTPASRTGTTATSGAHTHTISGSTGATGSGTAFDNRPVFATIVICKKD